VKAIWGNEGILWLNELPERIAYFSTQWHLQNIIPFENLSYNYVAQAQSIYHGKVVLKIGIPSEYFIDEMKALTFYNGHGCVKLLESDADKGGMLLTMAGSGKTARSLFPHDDSKAVSIACQIMNELHKQPVTKNAHFNSLHDWFSLFTTLDVPRDVHPYVAKAQLFVEQLEQSKQEEYVLHGDLHHDNIVLTSETSGIAIDPKGVIGERAYEVGAFMCNPQELSKQKNISTILIDRLDQFSKELEIDSQRLAKAIYTRIILSVCWTVQDKGNYQDDLFFADQLLLNLKL
jgi:streptomycin 6-kinase